MKLAMPKIEKLYEVAKEPDWDKDAYPISYPHFIRYFQSCPKQLEVHHVIVGICFTYSWMPTILGIYEDGDRTVEKCAAILTSAKAKKEITDEDFDILAQTFNNSLVGPSKLLHFIDPISFPIWDSRVRRAVKQEGKFSYSLFRKECLAVVAKPEFGELHKWIFARSKYPPGFEQSKIRSLDTLLYVLGKPN